MSSDQEHPPKELEPLDRALRGVRFSARASLGPELAGRARRLVAGREPLMEWWRAALGVATVSVVVASGGFGLWHGVNHFAALRTIDRCCQDLDGGGDADDGILVLASSGETVRRLSVYEDRDGSGGYTPGDFIRFDRKDALQVSGQPGGELVTREFCCLDYDGGGPADDALIIVSRPPDRVTMAAIYDRREERPQYRLK